VPLVPPRVEVETPLASVALVLRAKPVCVALASPVAVIEPPSVAEVAVILVAEPVVTVGTPTHVTVELEE
jgi:hypothetical protein